MKIQKTENSYIDFVKSLGWDNQANASNQNNIPHLDIYFMNKMSEGNSQNGSQVNNQGNFLEMEEQLKLKTFKPDLQYIKRINDPKNGYLWKAKVYDDFVGKSYDQMRNLLGNMNFMKNTNNEDILGGVDSNFLELEVDVSSFFIFKNYFIFLY